MGRKLLVGGLHLGVLWAFAVVQPLLDLLGDNPDFFVARSNTTSDIILLAVGLTLIPPLIGLALEALASLVSEKLRDGLHLVLVAILVAAIALQALSELADGPAAVLIAGALALGAGGAALYARTEWLPSLLTVLSPAPVLFVCLFLFVSDTKELVLPQDEVQAADIAVPGKTPVVVMLFDEFQGTMLLDEQGRIDRSLFPNFAELADRGAFYPNATTEADLTPRAAPAVMTGAYPTHDELPTAADHPESIFTLLGSDYAMNVAEPVTSVCPESLCGERARPPASERLDGLSSDLSVVYQHLLLPESMEDDLPAVDEAFQGFGEDAGGAAEGELPAQGEPDDDGVPTGPQAKRRGKVETQFNAPNESFLGRGNTFEDWLGELSGDRTLNFVHLELPHVPYEFYPDGQRYAAGLLETDGLRDSKGRNPEDQTVSRLLEQRLLLQIGFTDLLLGKVIDKLKAQGVWDQAIVGITADHGVSLQPGVTRRVPNKSNLTEIASVPLIVKGPGVPAGKIDDRQARTTDLLPTITQILGVPAPEGTQGSSLLGPAPDRPRVKVEDRYQRVISISVPKFEKQRQAILDQKWKLYGSGQGWPRVYRYGPDAKLIGQAVSKLPRGAAPASVTLASPEDYYAVDPKDDFLPGAIRAVFSTLGTGEKVAFAINDRVVATTRTYQGPDHVRAFVVVPPSSFKAGFNDVEVYSLPG